jgi:hypothetical protein|tara:strand:- start:56 stop:259 length:204 start_codon:yes stop_codon:yes gene_type:complete
MPLPKPSKKESQQEFVNRCMSDDMMTSEYKDQKQRSAVCYAQFKQRVKNKSEANWENVRKGDSLSLI